VWAGFPHSDILGSKPVCRLPEAFRRLPRPSSPVIAKASTTCTYSLDPITLSAPLQQSAFSSQLSETTTDHLHPSPKPEHRSYRLLQRLVAIASSCNEATIQSSNPVASTPFEWNRNAFTSSKFLKNRVQPSAFSNQLSALSNFFSLLTADSR
jgi:hypothetical protein